MNPLQTTPTSPDCDRLRRFSGTLVKLHYNDPIKNFAIFKFLVESTLEESDAKAVGTTITCKGRILSPIEKEQYDIEGKPDYNQQRQEWQLLLSSGKMQEASAGRGVMHYLAKEAPCIGEERAKLLYNLYPTNLLSALQSTPLPILAQKSSIPIADLTKLQIWLRSESVKLSTKELLYGLNLTQHQVSMFFARFGDAAVEKIRTDCFTLTAIPGIGFLTVCKIADKLGIPDTDASRIRAGVLYTLKHQCQEGGHVCLDHITLVNESCATLNIHKNHIIEEIKRMMADNLLCTSDTDPRDISERSSLFTFLPERT